MLGCFGINYMLPNVLFSVKLGVGAMREAHPKAIRLGLCTFRELVSLRKVQNTFLLFRKSLGAVESRGSHDKGTVMIMKI